MTVKIKKKKIGDKQKIIEKNKILNKHKKDINKNEDIISYILRKISELEKEINKINRNKE